MNTGTIETKIAVGLGDRSYDVRVGTGLIASAGRHIAPFARSRRLFVVSDLTVARLHGAQLQAGLSAANLRVHEVTLAPGEATKSFTELERLCDALLDLHIERGDVVVAFGGGVIGDLAGFAAGVLKRGIDYVQIPTTLLAQVDSSVGGKTAINARQGKNLVGLFHQPRLVLADLDMLNTLPRRDLLAGFAEVVKYGLLGDAAFFHWIETHGVDVLNGAPNARSHAVVTSVAAKARIVAADERESSVRALLNLGHTFGHALEAETGYSERLLHGEAVAIGMVLAFQLSERLGYCAAGTAQKIMSVFANLGLPTSPRDALGLRVNADTMLAHMAHDKKNRDGQLTLILARGIGQAFVTQEAPVADIHAVWHAAL